MLLGSVAQSRNQLRVNVRIVEECFGIHIGEEDIMNVMYGPDQSYNGRNKDALTSQVLRDDLVRKARASRSSPSTAREYGRRCHASSHLKKQGNLL